MTEAPPARCTLPRHEDDYFGFSIGYPPGWLVDYTTGSIVVAKDAKELEGAMVYPARLHRAVAAEDVATAFAQGLERSITARGGTFAMSDKHTNGKIARATLKATVGGVALEGPLEVVDRPGFATIELYWAPESELAADETTLRQVLACFQRKTVIVAKQPVAPSGGPVMRVGGAPAHASGGGATAGAAPAAKADALVPYSGRFFDAAMPAGWKLTDENEHGIDMIAGDGSAGAGFGYSIVPIKTARAYAESGVHPYWPDAHLVDEGPVAAPPGWSVYGVEFASARVHGYLQVAVGRGTVTTTTFTSAPPLWDAKKPTLQAVVASVKILPAAVAKVSADFRQQLASYPHYTPPSSTSSGSGSGESASDSMMASWKAREEAQDRTNLGFDDAIRGQDRAISPTTGEEYVCPNNMWNAEGPQGAGYYRQTPSGGTELLNVEQQAGGSGEM